MIITSEAKQARRASLLSRGEGAYCTGWKPLGGSRGPPDAENRRFSELTMSSENLRFSASGGPLGGPPEPPSGFGS